MKIFAGTAPFAQVRNFGAILLKVMNGLRPARPTDPSAWRTGCLTENIWLLMEDCWKGDPGARPTLQQAIERLRPELIQDERSTRSGITMPSVRFRGRMRMREPLEMMTVALNLLSNVGTIVETLPDPPYAFILLTIVESTSIFVLEFKASTSYVTASMMGVSTSPCKSFSSAQRVLFNVSQFYARQHCPGLCSFNWCPERLDRTHNEHKRL